MDSLSSHYLIKTLMALLIFAVAIAGGVVPILMSAKKGVRRFFDNGETFAKGIFLGAGLIHLLPAAQHHFAQVYKHSSYPHTAVICAVTIFLLVFLEQGVAAFYKNSKMRWLPYLLTVVLSIHSVIAGAALGVETTVTTMLAIFLAIIAHKAAAAFSLTINMRSNQLTHNTMIRLLILFSCMTPLGIFIGAGLHHVLHSHSGHLTQAIFNAAAAGTFIYIAAFNRTHEVAEPESVSTLEGMSYFISGLALMAIVAIWL